MTGLTNHPLARLHPVEGVMQRLCLGRSKVFELLATGELRSVKVGRRRLVSEAALVEFIEGLDEDQETATRRDGDNGPPCLKTDGAGGATKGRDALAGSQLQPAGPRAPSPRSRPTPGDAT